LIEAGWGRVVMQPSTAAYSGGGGTYGVSKLALLGLTRGFARELGDYGVTVNGIAPGPILNEATAATVPTAKIEAMVGAAPLRRGGEEADLVGALLFLCSDLSAWMTGQTLIVDLPAADPSTLTTITPIGETTVELEECDGESSRRT
jgi:NAD(P)-dependent dehydrogenase (short-subunit alcohol dehydrogenase family)